MFRFLAVLCLFFFSITLAQPSAQAELSAASIDLVVEALQRHVTRGISDAGGNFERENVHIMFAFSTGHFAVDPNLAEAARAIAWEFVRKYMVEGDVISVFAWEMTPWNHLTNGGNTFLLTGSSEASKENVSGLWPRTPRAGSIGGHDTELTIVSLANAVPDRQNVVMILLTNNAASVALGGASLLGTNDPRYQEVLRRWRRMGSVNDAGATLEAGFEVILPNGQRVGRRLDVVVMVPRVFAGTPVSGESRTNMLLNATRGEQTNPLGEFFWLWLLLAILPLLVISLFWRRGGKKLALVNVNGQKFSISDIRESAEVFSFVGAGYDSASGRTILSNHPEMPPIRVARAFRTRDGLRLKGDALKVYKVNGVIVQDPYLLKLLPDKLYDVEFRGEVAPDPGLPPRGVRDRLRIERL